MIVVAAVGGNALLRRGERLGPEVQARNAVAAAASLAPLAGEHSLVITHGNGPQIGLLALESGSSGASPAYPLDVVGAESQGMIGYLLELALRNALPDRMVATVLGEVLVASDDPAFRSPTKPIGPFYDRPEAEALAAANGWTMGREGARFRRLVPSPEPAEILELGAIRALLAGSVITISAGGGGVPVVRAEDGRLRGIEAVVDKDLTASLLAEAVGADALLLLTDVSCVFERWGEQPAGPIREATPEALRRLEFASGSMGPKVEAACRFAERTGGVAVIGSLERAPALLAGDAGTRVSRGGKTLEFWENKP